MDFIESFLGETKLSLSSVKEYLWQHPTKLRRLVVALLKNSSILVVVAVLALLGYKYIRNRRVRVFCMDTARNKKIIEQLRPQIERYSPTLYMPFSMMKVVVAATGKLISLEKYLRQDILLSDGEICHLDCYPRTFRTLPAATPIVVFVPGIFGTSFDKYAFEFCKMAYDSMGWRSFVLNRRLFVSPCKGKKLLSYNHYEDWRQIFQKLKVDYPAAPIYLVGVSMGSMNIQRYLIEYKDDPIVEAAATVSSPFDAGKTADTIHSNPLLRKSFHSTMVFMFRQHLHHEGFMELCRQKGICVESVLNSKDNKDFDKKFAALDHGMPIQEYYKSLSSYSHMDEITVPLLSINSGDDPVIKSHAIPMHKILDNPNIIQLMVAGGGHIEYFHGLKCEYVTPH